MIILDTDVLSAIMDPLPETVVIHWLNQQPASSIWTTTITLMEIRYGLESLPVGRRRLALAEGLEAVLEKEIENRLAPFDKAAAEHAAHLSASPRRAGRPIDFRDTMIAGIALATRATLATRNTSHFSDLSVPVVNPWKRSSQIP